MPTEEKVTRKLRAILSADVKGYSLLMANDEAYTIKKLEAYRDSMSGLIRSHSGRVVDAVGDNLLAEFSSVVDAVRCAVKIQKDLQQKNADLPADKRLEFRIGVNIGDVVQEGNRIYGNGVNVAARIEALAESGGICISRNAYSHVRDKLELGYEYLGEHSVKNIKRPVRVYKVLMGPEDAGRLIGDVPKPAAKKWIWATAVLAVIVITAIVWQAYQKMTEPEFEQASVKKMAYPLPDKPSIAVLPFDNMSGDPEQEYFSDGLTDQIITTLSKVSNLFVIARNSTFTYKGKPVRVQKVAEDLGVKYVLEGGVQRADGRIRITVQLINAITGHHVWSERYDRTQEDIFAIQDDITMEITKAIRVELIEGEQARIWQKQMTSNLKAYEKYLQGHQYMNTHGKKTNARARSLFEEAIALDPAYAGAYVSLGWTYWNDARFGWVESRAESIKMADKYAQKAVEIDDTLDAAYTLLCSIYLVKRQHDKSIAHAERAVTLSPNSAMANFIMAGSLGCSGRWEEGIGYAEKSIRLSPTPSVYSYWILGRAYFMTGKYYKAIETFKKAVNINPDYLIAHAFLAACYSSLDRQAEAANEAKEVLRINPQFNIESYSKTLPYKNKADIDRYVAALRKAGLPDKKTTAPLEKPSIAVLPFDNLSDDLEQEYFIDGIAEDIITALSKTDQLLVIARNSTFTYKNKPTNVKKIAEELDVRYVLEGSVRKNEDRVRITAQLIDALTGHHLWAERYDRNLGDIFALQDEITLAIIRAMQVELTEGEQARVTGRDTENLEAYLKAINAHDQFHLMNKEGSIKAKQLANEALMRDPNYAFPYATLANAHMLDVWFGYSESREESMRMAAEAVQKALSLDTSDPKVYHAVTNLYCMQGQYEKAISSAEQGIKIGPSNAEAYLTMGNALMMFYKNKEAIPFYEQAIRLDPYPSSIAFRALGSAYMGVGRYEDAVIEFKKALQLKPDDMFTHLELASTYVRLGREDEARIEVKEVIRITPDFSLNDFAKSLPDPEEYPETADYIESLRKAGLPE